MLELPPRPAPLAGRPLLLGLSGGLDSTALLHRLATAAHDGLRAIHVHHGLHPEADAWASHCRFLCAALDVRLDIVRVDVDRNAGRGIEAAARDARRVAFAATLGDGEVLVLAHHRDDQAETFLLRALRGSGVDGLAAMRPWCDFARGWLWRPLLGMPRSQLQDYAALHALSWIEDPSNLDMALDRNFLRHQVLPLLRSRWPAADAAFARSADLARQAGGLLDVEDERALEALRRGHAGAIDIAALRGLPASQQSRVLRRWVASLGLPPLPAQGIEQIRNALFDARDDGNAEFAWAGAWVRRWRGALHAGRARPPLPPDWRAEWSGRTPLPLPGGGTLRLVGAEGFEHPVVAIARSGGERIALPGRAHTHAIKHVLQDMDVPPWRRSRVPLLVDREGHVMAAGDVVASGAFKAWLDARGARLALDQA